MFKAALINIVIITVDQMAMCNMKGVSQSDKHINNYSCTQLFVSSLFWIYTLHLYCFNSLSLLLSTLFPAAEGRCDCWMSNCATCSWNTDFNNFVHYNAVESVFCLHIVILPQSSCPKSIIAALSTHLTSLYFFQGNAKHFINQASQTWGFAAFLSHFIFILVFQWPHPQ